MKNNPLELLVTALWISILTFAYALKVCERPLILAIADKGNVSMPIENDISNYYNAVWLMIVTMTTVGYGDFYPRTIPGRAIAVFSCVFGVVNYLLTKFFVLISLIFFKGGGFSYDNHFL